MKRYFILVCFTIVCVLTLVYGFFYFRSAKVYRGICMSALGSCTNEDYTRIKGWGLNSIMIPIWWTASIETYEDHPYFYNESFLKLLEEQIALAESHRLKVFLSFRTSMNQKGGFVAGWSDIKGADYINLNLLDISGIGGRDRFCAMLEMMVKRFPSVAICPWHFPYHGESVSQEQASIYYETTFPLMVETIRKQNDDVIIFSPIHQSLAPLDVPFTDRLLTGFYENPPLNYGKNILYNINTHDSIYLKISKGIEPWDGDIEELNRHYAPVFSQKLRYCCIELGAINIHTPDTDERPIDPTRLAWLEETLKMHEKIGASWFYWRYEPDPNVQSPFEPSGIDTPIAELLAKYSRSRN